MGPRSCCTEGLYGRQVSNQRSQTLTHTSRVQKECAQCNMDIVHWSHGNDLQNLCLCLDTVANYFRNAVLLETAATLVWTHGQNDIFTWNSSYIQYAYNLMQIERFIYVLLLNYNDLQKIYWSPHFPTSLCHAYVVYRLHIMRSTMTWIILMISYSNQTIIMDNKGF